MRPDERRARALRLGAEGRWSAKEDKDAEVAQSDGRAGTGGKRAQHVRRPQGGREPGDSGAPGSCVRSGPAGTLGRRAGPAASVPGTVSPLC